MIGGLIFVYVLFGPLWAVANGAMFIALKDDEPVFAARGARLFLLTPIWPVPALGLLITLIMSALAYSKEGNAGSN